jgi:predicted extracellular nuclease
MKALRNSFFRNALIAVVAIIPALTTAKAQTNPVAQALPFSLTSQTGATLPAGVAVHKFSAVPTTRITTPGTGDSPYNANFNTGGWRDEGVNGIGLLGSGSASEGQVGAIVVAINTTGKTGIQVSWICHTILQQASRDNSVALQYRAGTSGNFIDVGTNSTYTSQGKVAIDNSPVFSETLPAGAENQAVVQVRWIYWESNSSSGSRDRIAVDDISITANVATASEVRVETLSNGSGIVLPAQTLQVGSSLTAYAITRDATHFFVANAPATWSLVSVTGGIVSGDLVPSGDGKSATFAPGAAGTAIIRATVAGLNSVDSGVITASTTPPPPVLQSSIPANGASGVAASSTITLAFDQAVITAGSWFTLTGSSSGTIAASASGNGASRTLTHAQAFASGETVTLTVLAAQVTNGSGVPMAQNATVAFTVASPFTPIHTVQGAGTASPVAGTVVTIEGVVVGNFQGASPALGGFFVQEQDAEADSDPLTSEGIFVFDRGSSGSIAVNVGDIVQVTGTVVESNGLTQINSVTSVVRTATGAPLPVAQAITLPLASVSDWERYEGMRVTFPQTLTVCDNHLLGQYGELGLAAGGLLRQPTEDVDPNDSPASGTTSSGTSNVAAVLAAADLNARRFIIMDDNSSASYPDPTPFLDASGTRRAGDGVVGLTGVLSYSFGGYRVQPTAPVTFAAGNPRSATPPSVPGRLKVTSFNVLNYFTTFGSRGASDAAEFSRQQAKIVATLSAIHADVFGLVEMENNGTTTIDNLVAALNAAVGAGTYARVTEPPQGGGTDTIRVALIYKPASVTPIGASISQVNATWSRQPLAQLFQENSTGERFIVCVNHFKSKSPTGATGADADQNDGQGAYNDRRKQQANLLISFLNGIKTSTGEQDVMVLGDLNAYAQEDPIDILRAAGYVELSALYHPAGSYSYLFDGRSGHLDYALANASMAQQIRGAKEWNINSPEPLYYDYNTENKSAAQQAINVGTPYRSSDHDPVTVGVSLTTTYASWASRIAWPPGADTTPNGDADHDGLSNVEEFVLNTQPTVPDAHLQPSGSNVGDVFHFDYRLRNSLAGITVTPQWSTNLTHWNDISTTTLLGAIDPLTDLLRASLSLSAFDPALTRAFLRVKIEVAP